MADTYNGWPNYQTWNVMLWLDNDEGAERYYTERVRKIMNRDLKCSRRVSAATARAIAENALGPETGDGVHLSNSRIRWGAIAEAMREAA